MEKNQTITPLAFSVSQVATMLALSSRTVHSLIHSGDLPHFRVGVRVLVPESALREFIENRTQKGVA